MGIKFPSYPLTEDKLFSVFRQLSLLCPDVIRSADDLRFYSECISFWINNAHLDNSKRIEFQYDLLCICDDLSARYNFE